MSSATVVANIAAAPTPCTVRAAMSTGAFGASPQINDETANTARPPTYVVRRPMMSPSDPAPSTSAANATA